MPPLPGSHAKPWRSGLRKAKAIGAVAAEAAKDADQKAKAKLTVRPKAPMPVFFCGVRTLLACAVFRRRPARMASARADRYGYPGRRRRSPRLRGGWRS